MRKPFLLLFALLTLATAAFAYGVTCAYHDWAVCYPNGRYQWVNGHQFQGYNCSCGDAVWVRTY
jgi:hypothetical protein